MVEEPNKTVVDNQVDTTKTNATQEVDYKKLYEESLANNKKLKSRVDELCTDVKNYKEKEIARMTDEQKAQLAQQERELEFANVQKELATLRKQNSLANSGFTKEEIAKLMENDSPDTYAQIMSDRMAKALESAKLQNIKDTTHTPQTSDGKIVKSFNEYSMKELNDLKQTNPQLYRKILNSK